MAPSGFWPEAGYPEGFRITLHTPNDRWPNDARLAQAVAPDVDTDRYPYRSGCRALDCLCAAPRAHEYAMQIGAWGSSTGEASNFLVNTVATHDRQRLTGANNNARFSSPVFDEFAARGSATLDDAAREKSVARGHRPLCGRRTADPVGAVFEHLGAPQRPDAYAAHG
jgi:peptide/nickel transport system substrate-binding protein